MKIISLQCSTAAQRSHVAWISFYIYTSVAHLCAVRTTWLRGDVVLLRSTADWWFPLLVALVTCNQTHSVHPFIHIHDLQHATNNGNHQLLTVKLRVAPSTKTLFWLWSGARGGGGEIGVVVMSWGELGDVNCQRQNKTKDNFRYFNFILFLNSIKYQSIIT